MRRELTTRLAQVRTWSLIGLAVLTALLLAACGGSTQTTGPAVSPPEAQVSPSPAAAPTSQPPGPAAAVAPQPPSPAPSPVPKPPPAAITVDVPRDFPISVYRGEDILGGKELRFSAIFATGKPVILNFFAGLCPPCRAEMPDIQSVSAQYKDRVTIFSLDIGPFVGLGSRDDGKELVQELGVTYPTGTTFDRQVVSAYQVLGMPTTVFITPEGKVWRKWTGLLTRSKLAELTEGLLKASGT